MKAYSIGVTFVLLCCLFLLFYTSIEQRKKTDLLSKYDGEREYYNQRFELINYEKELKVKSFAKKIKIDYKNIIALSGNHPQALSAKILIIAAPEFSGFSNNSLFQAYKKDYSGEIALIVSSPDSSLVNKLFQSMMKIVPVFADIDLQLLQRFNLAENETVVLIRNNNGVVIYSYVVEEGNPLKDAEESEIIMSLLQSEL